MAAMSMLAPMFLSVCTGKYWGAICPSRSPPAWPSSGRAEDVESIARVVERHEERKALDVIPVGVRQQDAGLAAPLSEGAFHERHPQVARARAAVER